MSTTATLPPAVTAPEATAAEPTQEPADFLDAPALAQRLGKCPLTIRNWAKAGLIPSIHIGRSVIFCYADVREALRRRSRGGGQL